MSIATNAGQDLSGTEAKRSETLEEAQERANRAERKLKQLEQDSTGSGETQQASVETLDSVQQLREDTMMAHLMDALTAGKDIGHYGRLVFAMVASRFLTEEEVIGWLAKDPDFGAAKAAAMLHQVEGRHYNPPRRERIIQWQSEQDFPILPNPDDPDCGNVYKSLKFPDEVYDHIETYQAEKANAE